LQIAPEVAYRRAGGIEDRAQTLFGVRRELAKPKARNDQVAMAVERAVSLGPDLARLR
jgi:hypothetical protein